MLHNNLVPNLAQSWLRCRLKYFLSPWLWILDNKIYKFLLKKGTVNPRPVYHERLLASQWWLPAYGATGLLLMFSLGYQIKLLIYQSGILCGRIRKIIKKSKDNFKNLLNKFLIFLDTYVFINGKTKWTNQMQILAIQIVNFLLSMHQNELICFKI